MLLLVLICSLDFGTSNREQSKIAKSLVNSSLSASLDRPGKFRIRHNIGFKAISGEVASVNSNDVCSFLDKLSSSIKGYSSKDVYNADENGLILKTLPNNIPHSGKQRVQVASCRME